MEAGVKKLVSLRLWWVVPGHTYNETKAKLPFMVPFNQLNTFKKTPFSFRFLVSLFTNSPPDSSTIFPRWTVLSNMYVGTDTRCAVFQLYPSFWLHGDVELIRLGVVCDDAGELCPSIDGLGTRRLSAFECVRWCLFFSGS